MENTNRSMQEMYIRKNVWEQYNVRKTNIMGIAYKTLNESVLNIQ